jgi:hypothetical protein
MYLSLTCLTSSCSPFLKRSASSISMNLGLSNVLYASIWFDGYYKTAFTLAHLLGHKSLEDYVSHIVVQILEMEINGGEINIDSKKLF